MNKFDAGCDWTSPISLTINTLGSYLRDDGQGGVDSTASLKDIKHLQTREKIMQSKKIEGIAGNNELTFAEIFVQLS